MILNYLEKTFLSFDKSIRIIEILAGAIIFNIIMKRFIKLPQKLDTKRAKTLFSLIQSTISIAIFILGITFILSVLEIDVTPILASAGIIGIAVGFGSQALVKDLIAGLFLIAEDSISIGDLVEIGGNRGVVLKIGIRTIILKDENGALRIIPAGRVNEVVNLSREEALVNIDIPIKNTVSIDKVLEAMRDVLSKIQNDKRFQKLLTKKPELKGIDSIEPGKLIIKSILYATFQNQWRVKRELLYRIKKKFEKDNIELA
ncbi:hypothetical protein COV53_02525 [Candidatus Gottesmanbacteria bacterium CG11_big_fil_rev_8_21_14_0_20_37_11]|uniref:Mechanosensitive ion channel protein MscS n=2 Tax=Candidatus Gottesmaniibacteriota TaxID=1752720 RepID=A0A1J4TTE6_9BACT|nr:MAG: hypothetical protein AUJ73_02095 [Candidatus Gottesmanbacteria bacterium CG1_02_37_22]PIP32129.1 MAG: hypothetical protein COX23_06420 [Candidatus Gottesmanbacteria bacterium CG23_combo_of_CG06-09_8_20_14_all_37_19]PIR08538.1 MAG: hypothetical protein COV53_02525 [Candidatus Gottesmanbacteria bacterium CG11_big_fil_rev_8_21_14_0_20_37_11]